jgi:hypothetical protein
LRKTEAASQKIRLQQAGTTSLKPLRQAVLPTWNRILPLALLGTYLLVLLSRFFHSGNQFLSFFEDDFFYYLVVARNLVHHGISTFNGIQPTNGYHPLWLLINAVLYRIFGDSKSLFVALVLIVWLLVCGTYRALRRSQSLLHVADGYGLAFALFSLTFMAVVSRTGMEVSLTLFFLALFWQRMAAQPLEDQTPRSAVLSGLLASGLVLSRIDALMVVVAYGALMLYKPTSTRKTAFRNLLWFGVGLLPVAAYFLFNRIEFGAFLPISGIAKNLKEGLIPSSSTVKSLLAARSLNVLLTWPACVIGILYFLHLLSGPEEGESPDSGGRRVQLCVFLHPVLFYTILSITSDWPIWTWYLYPLVPIGALLGPVAIADWKRLRNKTAIRGLTGAVACIAVLILISLIRPNATEVLLYQQAVELQGFAKAHPGRYAMGGGAGMPSYLMPAPMVQLEGLTGDAAFVELIKRKEPLVQALAELKVDYYATMLLSKSGRFQGQCFDLREPEMAGDRSPVMAGHICVKPVADYLHAEGRHLLVFDVDDLTAQKDDADEEEAKR